MNDDEVKEGDFIPKAQANQGKTDIAPVSNSSPVQSLATSWVERKRLEGILKETQLKNAIAQEGDELNIALTKLADSEVIKETALDRLRNLPEEKAKIKRRRDTEDEIMEVELNAELAEARTRLAKENNRLAKTKAQRKKYKKSHR